MFGGKDKHKKDKDDKKDDDKHKKEDSKSKKEESKDKDNRKDERMSREVRDYEASPKKVDTPAQSPNPAADKAKEEEEKRKRDAAAAEEEERKKVQLQKQKEEEEKRKEDERKKKEEEDKKEEKRRREKEEVERKKKEEEDEKKKLAAAAAKKEEKKDDDVNDEVEIQSLEAVKTDPSESKTVYREVYDLFPSEVYTSYDKLQNFARDLNTLIPVLEIAVVGPKSSGKSAIVEAILGRPVNVVGSGGASKRPLFFQLINNLDYEQPRVTIKRDSTLSEFDHDVEVPVDSLPEAIASRNKSISEEPIFVHYEYKYCLNMTLIDTPGLRKAGEAGEKEVENIVLNIVRPAQRLILAVEAAQDGTAELPTFVKRIDPELSRSTFVYTKFFSQLQDFNNTRAVNRFLSGTLPDVKTFFTTLPSAKVRAKFRDTEKFQEKVWQAYRRDMNYLEQLQYDKRYERNIGVHALRRYLLNLAWRSYQEAIPRILKHLRSKKQVTEQRLKEVQQQLSGLDSSKLRSLASNYVINFLQIVEQLIEGTSEGNPAVNGQSLEEEKSQQGDGDWVDLYNRPIKFEPEDWGIPYWESKLYGGQQFERLLAEFKAVSDHTQISEVTMDDVATAAGINKLNNVPNYAWAASDLAQQKSQDALVPLIEQLCERAVYIIKRLTDVVEKILDARKKKWQASYRGVDVTNIEQYPYFTHHVKDLFYKYVDETSKVCKEKCMDEFLSTRTIYWDLTEYPEHNIPIDRNDHEDTKTTVVQLARQLFTNLRQRITKNVLLKFYNFFLVPIQVDLWNEIQGKITSLSDQSLEQIFEVSATKDKLREDEKHLQVVLKKCAEQDAMFLDASTHFCHPIVINSINASDN